MPGTFLRLALLFGAFYGLTIWTYGASCADVPRRDDLWFMAERAYFPDSLEWWTHTLSFTRTRKLAPGDYLLCRPGHYAVLSTMDILFRGRREYAACSFVFMALAGTSLYLATRGAVGRVLALLLAAHFVTQYPGLEIVCWRHISPYLLSVACLGFGWAVLQGGGTRGRCAVTGMFWTMGALFHEVVPVTLLLVGGYSVVVGVLARRVSEESNRPPLAYASGHTFFQTCSVWTFLVPVAVYATWSGVDFLLHHPPVLALEQASRSTTFVTPFASLTTPFNAAATAFLKAASVHLTPGPSGLWVWEFDTGNRTFQRAGAVLLSLIACLIPRLLRARGPASDTAAMGLALLTAIVTALGLGRGLTRGPGYLHQATYYYSLTAFALSLVTAGSLRLLVPQNGSTIAKTLKISVAVWLGAMTLVGASRIRDTLEPHREHLTRWQERHERLRSWLNDENLRLAGIAPGHEDAVQSRVSLLLLQECRWADSSRRGVVLAVHDSGEIELQPIPLGLKPLPATVRSPGTDRQEILLPDHGGAFRIVQHEAWVERFSDDARRNIVVLANHPSPRALRVVKWNSHAVLMDGGDVLTSQLLSSEASRP